MTTRYYILEGDTTTAGGIVQKTSNSSALKVHGKQQSYLGDDVYCPACKSMGKIGADGARLKTSVNGFQPALHDDLCLCKCSPPPRLINSQTTFKEIVENHKAMNYAVEKIGSPIQQSLAPNTQPNSKIINGYYYNINTGAYEGNISNYIGDKDNVFACGGKKDGQFINPQKISLKHKEFQICSRIITEESGTASIECIYFAFTATNWAKRNKKKHLCTNDD